jgi:hypothetical protein
MVLFACTLRYPPYTNGALRVFRIALGLHASQPRLTWGGLASTCVWLASVAGATAAVLAVMKKI